ncbi:MAG: sigma factor-like helix-turn-helix DNA-binding protein [Micromonospora sp.]
MYEIRVTGNLRGDQVPDRDQPLAVGREFARPSGYDDQQLTAWALAAGQGDPQALAAFVRSTQHDVWRFLHHLLDLPSVDDLTREVYRRAVRDVAGCREGRPPRLWLLNVTRRLAREHMRPSRPIERVSNAGRGHEDDLRRMVRRLPEELREAFVATQLLGLSYVEAARVCECPVAAIRTRVARARDDLVTGARESID